MSESIPTPELESIESASNAPELSDSEGAAAINSKYMAKPDDSYTKLAMRNMVRRGGTSLFHFGLTLAAVLGFLVGMSYLFR